MPSSLVRSFSGLNLPLALLVALLQRTPVVRTVATVVDRLASSPLGAILRGSVASAATLGALHSLAGATTLSTNAHPSPLSATVGVAIPQVAFAVIGSGVGAPGSWQVSGTIAPGLAFNGFIAPGTMNVAYPILSGTPTTAGTFTMQLKAWENPKQKGNASPLFSYVVTVAPATATAPSFTTQPQNQMAMAGNAVTFSATVSGSPSPTVQWVKDGTALAGATSPTLTLPTVTAANAGTYVCVATNAASAVSSAPVTLTVTAPPAPVISRQPATQAAVSGASAMMSADATGFGNTFQWQHNGANVPGATSAMLTVNSVQPADAGIYAATVTNLGGSTTSQPAILGMTSTAKVIGTGTEVGPNILHPNGNIFDQILLEGAAATVTADPGQVLRISYVDLNDDIVQIEFAGTGTLSLVLAGPSGPTTPAKYNQPTVSYMRGHAGIVIVGADETTNVSVFSVGRGNAVNQALFRPDVTYDGFADIAFLAISSANGKFGGVRTANASYFATTGITGLYAPNVQFTGPVYIGDINASDTATPMLVLGSGSNVRITGGDLFQTNSRAVQVAGITQLQFVAGSNSHSTLFPAQLNQARLEENGTDVTAQIVVNPVP